MQKNVLVFPYDFIPQTKLYNLSSMLLLCFWKVQTTSFKTGNFVYLAYASLKYIGEHGQICIRPYMSWKINQTLFEVSYVDKFKIHKTMFQSQFSFLHFRNDAF